MSDLGPKFKYSAWVYEAVGTALFTVISNAAWTTTSDWAAALYFGLIWTLCYVTFKDTCQAYFKDMFAK